MIDRRFLRLICACVLAGSSVALAQSGGANSQSPAPLEVLKDRPDVQAAPGELGARFDSMAAGISFNVPAGMVKAKKTGEEIVRYVNQAKGWELVAAKSITNEPIPLSTSQDASTQPVMKFQRSGIMELVISQIKSSNSGTEIARQDIINIGENKAGMIAAHFTVGTQRRLLQQVIIQANKELYYTITLTTPATKNKADDENDPDQRQAVETFGNLVDTVKLADLGAIRKDQEDRLIRTRALYVQLTPPRIKSALVPEQWLRLMKDGKDVGYTYMIQETDAEGASQGIKIGIRSRTMPDTNTQADGETWYFMSFDRRHETWSNLALVQDRKTGAKNNMSEIGSSDATIERVYNPNRPAGVIDDDKQPPVDTITDYELTVTKAGKTVNSAPLKMRLPPYYLPQALGQILPHVVPLNIPKTYMFYMYVSDQQKVMARYFDVGQLQLVSLNGQQVQAVPITDRIGLEGSPVIHYMSPDGKYLGSVNEEEHTVIVPTDAATLQKIWANNANLTRPPVPDAAKP